jgi:hypothetical protein
MMEGKDVASGLKWLSCHYPYRSTHASIDAHVMTWALEELLESWVVKAFLIFSNFWNHRHMPKAHSSAYCTASMWAALCVTGWLCDKRRGANAMGSGQWCRGTANSRERATLWMEDLVFHPDAAEDDRLIQEEILRRYQAHFLPV